MNVEVLKQDKNEVELKIDSLTVAEVLRVYINKEGVEFAAWRREHLLKPSIFLIKTSDKTAKKVITDAIVSIKKDLTKIESLVKKK